MSSLLMVLNFMMENILQPSTPAMDILREGWLFNGVR